MYKFDKIDTVFLESHSDMSKEVFSMPHWELLFNFFL